MALPRSVLLIITGSVASYKSLELIRLLRAQKIEVTAILTKSGAEFITPLAVSSLTGTKTYTDLFSLTDETEMGHIQLSRVADLVLVAPASADILAKMAAGIADNLATTALLATNKPVFVAPAMNHKMWHHPATQRNIAQLRADGVAMIDPTEGDMACGEFGIGRMAEPATIVEFLKTQFHSSPRLLPSGQAKGPLKGKHAIVTSGATSETLDPVRFIGNLSSGKQGHAIAEALAAAGAKVTLVCGQTNLPTPAGVVRIDASNAEAMLAVTYKAMPADIFIAAAAVADWRPASPAPQKLKKKGDKLVLELVPTIDVLATVAKEKNRPTLVIGFAAETENLLTNARAKRKAKHCDWLLANDVSEGKVFGEEQNSVTLITATNEETWPEMNKRAIAEALVARITDYFTSTAKGKSA